MKYQSLYDIYMDEVKKMATSQDDWKAFLEYASKMYGYKFSTLVTAFAQSPNYTQLVTYEQWNKLGYRIRRGEKSTPVLMDNFYKMSHMFDVTQLEKKAVIKNWMVKDTEREIFKQRFIANSKTLNGSFDDIKAIKIVQGLDVLYCQPGNQNLGHFEELLYQSIDYMISERCNLKYEVKIPKIELSLEQMTAIGWAAMSVARDILLESKEIVNELRREEQLGRNENIIQGEGRNTVRNSERGTSTGEAKQVFNGSKETLGEDERTRIGKSDHSREDDGEDERDRKRDREPSDSISNSDSEEKSVDDKRRDIEDVRAESNSGSSKVNIGGGEEVDEQDSTSSFNIMYFEINEQLAKQAHTLMSFQDYVEGSKTEYYKSKVNKAYELAAMIKEKKPDEAERAYNLAEKYSKKLADNINRESQIGCMCPSVMISGAGNFPVKKKQKQNAASERNHQAFLEVEGIIQKLESILHGKEIIKSNDENAIEKLEEKLSELRQKQVLMKNVNAFYRKNKTLKGCPHLSEKNIEKMEGNIEGKPFPSYMLTNNNQNIHRIEERIDKLKQVKAGENQIKDYSQFKVIHNIELMRLQIIFEGKPDESVREVLKQNSFKWSPKNEAWQRQLTPNAECALKKVIESLGVKEVMETNKQIEMIVKGVLEVQEQEQEDVYEMEL